MMKRKIAAIWCRVSTSDQRELSLDSQEVAVRKALENQGYQIPSDYVLKVDWSSLDLMSCPEFQQLRRWVADGSINAVGTLDRDRLQAQGLQRLIFLSECRDLGVPMVTVQGAPMLEGGEGQLVELALALGKERSVLRAQQGARDGLRDRARLKGLPPNMSGCYGMRWQDNRLVPDANYTTAQEIWRMGLAGWKIKTIATELTQRGIPTPSGKPRWSTYSVRHILKNRTYAGVVEALKTESVEPKVRKAATYGKSGRRSRPEEERIPLEGLLEQSIVTEDEYRWMQERLLDNKRLAEKNTRLRNYLLKGMVRCAACGGGYTGATFNRREKIRSYYNCSRRWNPGPDGLKCQSRSLVADPLEEAVFSAVVDFLHSPQGFESEVQRRRGITAETTESLHREFESLKRQLEEEQAAEARAFRLAARTQVSEAVFNQEVGLIRTKQRWIGEQIQRVQAQLEDIERYSFSEEAIALLRHRLEARLAGSTPEDQRFVLEAVGARVIVQADRSWELELQIPRSASEPDDALQIVNTRPGSNSPGFARGSFPLE
jgi:site-specific DNA recombinase